MSQEIVDKIRADFDDFTKSEKSVAAYILNNLQELPFETAASLASAVGVSQMTVSRFLRAIGYNGLNGLKEDLRRSSEATPLLVGERAKRIEKLKSGDVRLADNFELELQALLNVYELVDSKTWQSIVSHLARSTEVYIAGFQTVAGLAADFALRLNYLRPGTRALDPKSGMFEEIFAADKASCCLVIVEMRRYSRLSIQLAEAAKRSKIPVVILCDKHCSWAYKYTELVLQVAVDSILFWDNQAPFVTLFGLLLNEVAEALGDQVAERTKKLAKLQEAFGAFQD